MLLLKANNLVCPLDGLPFGAYGTHLQCAGGHSFDVARQGYVHLLPVQHKKSREPGDSRAMVEARGRFLDAGYYAPIAERLSVLALHYLPPATHPCVLDAGCGEGYYLARFATALEASGTHATATLIGLDIAKPAVIAAARRSKHITWLVASNRNPCVLPQSVDIIFCMFGFADYAAFAAALRPGGILILVDAGMEHLMQLREIIYPEVRKAPPPALDRAHSAGFRLIDTQSLNYRINHLPREQIDNLLLMTPHLFRATHAGKQAIAQLRHLDLTVDVVFRVLEIRQEADAETGG